MSTHHVICRTKYGCGGELSELKANWPCAWIIGGGKENEWLVIKVSGTVSLCGGREDVLTWVHDRAGVFTLVKLRTLKRFLQFCFAVQMTCKIKVAWLVAVSAALWSVWLARNEVVFKDKHVSAKDILFFAKLRAFMWCKASDKS
ncbi:hypothetical protein GQ457_05G017340 [Hibiscus cannabinus]